MNESKINKLVKRQMIIAVTSDFLATIASGIFAFAIGIHILLGTNSVLTFGVLQMLGPIIGLLLSGIIGKVVDQHSHKKIILIMQGLTFLSVAVYALAVYLWPSSLFVETMIVVSITTIVGRFSATAYAASVISLVPADQVQRLSSLEQSAGALAGIIAPIVGGAIYGLVSFETIILIMMLDSVVVFISTLALNFHAFKQPQKNEASVVSEESEKTGYIAFLKATVNQYPGLLFTLILAPFANLILSGIGIMLSVLILKELRLSANTMGLSEAAISVGIIIGSMLTSMHKTFKQPICVANFAVISLGIPMIVFGVIAWLTGNNFLIISSVLGMCLLFGVIIIYANVPLDAFQVRNIPQAKQGRVFGLISGLAEASSPIGILIATGLITVISAKTMFVIYGSSLIIGGIIVWLVSGRQINKAVIARIKELDALEKAE